MIPQEADQTHIEYGFPVKSSVSNLPRGLLGIFENGSAINWELELSTSQIDQFNMAAAGEFVYSEHFQKKGQTEK